MRTVTFESVFKAVVKRHGFDPFGDAITHDTAHAVAMHITERAETAWMMWRWPDLTKTEERAYRQVWNASVQYRRVSEDDLPDEVYYIPAQKYYKVILGATDPPIGSLPTNATYWSLLDPVTTFVSRDQAYKPPLGQVIGVYGSNPSLNGCCTESCLDFSPSEKGIKICCGPPTTVFIQYTLDPPEYTMTPYISGKSYVPGDCVFYFVTGDCYRCVANTSSHNPTETDFWVLVPVPAMFSTYLKEGAYADGLKETISSSSSDSTGYGAAAEAQARAARITEAEQLADQSIEGLIDDLMEQGQKFHYVHPQWARRTWTYDGTLWWSQQCGRMCHSEPWSGDIVHVLSDVPSPLTSSPPLPEPTMIYRPEIHCLLVSQCSTSLQAFPTTNLAINTLVLITIGIEQQSWRVDAGPATAGDPGEISPSDYNVVTNDKHYRKVI